MPSYAQIDTESFYKLSETLEFDSYSQYNFGDLPFAVTVFVFPAERGVITEWFVSSRRRIDDPQASLVMKLLFRLREEDQWIIEGKINQLWDNYLQELAFESVEMGNTEIARFANFNPSKSVYSEFLYFHLHAHDQFAQLLKDPKMSKVEKTANWHLFLQSFGIKQTHQIIANYENRFLRSKEDQKPVNTLSITQRLQIARRKGLIPAAKTSPRERKNINKDKEKTHENKRGDRTPMEN